MHLDMMTMSVVAITVTAVLGLVFAFNWARQVGSSFVGLWGLAMLSLSGGIAVATLSRGSFIDALIVGQSAMILADSIKWHACRRFAHRHASVLITLVGPIAYLLLAVSGSIESFSSRLMIVCALAAAYNFAAAVELARDDGEQLPSRWLAVGLLILTGVSFLSWVPLTTAMPIPEVGDVLISGWFPSVILITVLLRVALAFIVLSMAKEREEQEQRTDALTDSLTGLPNRRALFEAADVIGQRRILGGTPVAVLIFDLDHFKETNDSYGHDLGDEVLKIFAKTVAKHLDGKCIIGRLGGEEFAAILPGADGVTAGDAAETVRRAFSRSAAFENGLAVGATVSVGVTSGVDVDTDFSGLFRRADAALYIAKRAGRDQVALVESDGDIVFPGAGSTVCTSPSRLRPTPPVVRRYPIRIA